MKAALLFFFSTSHLLYAELQCPKNTLLFDMEICDPNRRSQCPSGFTCRKSNDTENQNHIIYLCCETKLMTAADWFIEKQLSPKVFPKAPEAKFISIEMAPLDERTAFPAVHTGDEVQSFTFKPSERSNIGYQIVANAVVVLSYPQYRAAVVQSVLFTTPPPSGGFLHVMTVIDPLHKPFAVFFTYNLPSTGVVRLPIPNVLQGMTGRSTYIDKTTTIAEQKSYRSQYVVLAYRTVTPVIIGNHHKFINPQELSTGFDLMGDCNNVECLIETSLLSKQLGTPISGSIFYLTTKSTIFETEHVMNSAPTSTVSARIIAAVAVLLYVFA